jgi:hypothetical protein
MLGLHRTDPADDGYRDRWQDLYREEGCSCREKAAPAAAAPAAPKKLAPGSAGDVKLYDTDPRDAAMIMAIVGE